MTHRQRQAALDDILQKTMRLMREDCDVSHASLAICDGLAALLEVCDVERIEQEDPYTRALVDAYVGFVVAHKHGVHGSNADYCATNATSGISGYRIRLRDPPDADALLHDLRVGIHANGLNPRRSFGVLSRAGVPIGRKCRH